MKPHDRYLPLRKGTLVVVAHGRKGERLALTETACAGPGRWPYVRKWTGAGWTINAAKARVLRVATEDDLRLFSYA